MIVITRNIANPITNVIFLTLYEMQTSKTAWYHFKFTNRITNDVVQFFKQDISTKLNYQKFEIGSDLFDDVDTGYFTYEVKGANSTGTAAVGGVIEVGYMNLLNDTTFEPVNYTEQSNQFKTYNG